MVDIRITPPKKRGFDRPRRVYTPPVTDENGKHLKSRFTSPSLGSPAVGETNNPSRTMKKGIS